MLAAVNHRGRHRIPMPNQNTQNSDRSLGLLPDNCDTVVLGGKIRKLRKARGKSLADIAQAINRSVSFISQIERGRSQPSIGDLRGIAQLLGLPLGWFFLADTVPPEESGRVVRAAKRQLLGSRTDGLLEELLSPDIGGAFETFLSTFKAGVKMSEFTQRDTEEEGYIIQGKLDLWIGKKLFHLHAGDSFRIVREPFRWANSTTTDTVAIWVISPPTY
jgi:transcriptional regulator with XRE-family HTH domain